MVGNCRLYQFVLLSLVITCSLSMNEDTCTSETSNKSVKYLFYTVNYGEGFNLRRDVYIRFANLVQSLNTADNDHWILVVPPWYRLYHWFNSHTTEPVNWSQFFDLISMNKYIPVIELDQYIRDVGRHIDRLYILQPYMEPFDGHWVMKHHEKPCIEPHEFRHTERGWEGSLSGRLVNVGRFVCMSVQGTPNFLLPLIRETKHSLALARGENLLHDHYGQPEFWRARRSMRFAAPLLARAARFRRTVLNTTDEEDGVTLPLDWRDEKPHPIPPRGGSYLAVHWRRRDFLRAKGNQVPSVRRSAKQLRHLLDKLHLKHLFLATDAPEEEVAQLTSLIQPHTVVRYTDFHEAGDEDTEEERTASSPSFADGQLAIIDQIIAARARYFVGSHESTFSFRIQEEREILGFPPDTTFNRLCGSSPTCEPPGRWTLVY